MPQETEKRGPIEKGQKGWPINPLGVIVLVAFMLIAAFLIGKPLLSRKSPSIQSQTTSLGQISAPLAGQIIKEPNFPIELSLKDQSIVDKVQFWAKTYTDNKWEIIQEMSTPPFRFDWQIPSSYKDKAIAITTHIYLKDGQVIKDAGGWREGIIILSP